MDCHKPLVLVLGLVAGAGGCGHLGGGKEVATAQKKKEEEPVTHKAPTYVAFGDFRARLAAAPEATPAQQEALREEARQAYVKAIEVDPEHLPAHRSLARLLTAAGDHAGAGDAYRKALALDDADGGLWFELGMVQGRQKDWPQALESLGKAAEREPANKQYATALGFALARAGRHAESLACFTRAHGEAQAHYNLARMLRHTQKPEMAREQLALALEKDPNLAAARSLLTEMDGQGGTGVKAVSHTESKPAEPEGRPALEASSSRAIRLPPTPVIPKRAKPAREE